MTQPYIKRNQNLYNKKWKTRTQKEAGEAVHQPTIRKHSLHDSTNENGLRLVYFAVGSQMAIKSYVLHAHTNPSLNLALLK
jgi:hypothetical protein